MGKIGDFFKEVKHEMSETSWPDAKDMRKYSVSIFTIIILFALFFLASESIIVWLLSFI